MTKYYRPYFLPLNFHLNSVHSVVFFFLPVLCWPTGATLVREENQTVEDANSGNEHNMLGRKMCLDISSPKSMICDILGGL